MQKRSALIISLLIPQLTGALSAYLSASQREVYQRLNLPAFAPPAWVFGPVWILLYLLMGIACYRVYLKGPGNPLVKKALLFYLIQLLFNFAWSIIFFRFELLGIALVEIIILFIFIIITTYYFYKAEKTAAYLMIPYIIWVAFASLLNYYIWLLN